MRPYYRGSEYHFSFRISYMVKWLLIINVAAFFLQSLSRAAFGADYLVRFFGLTSPLVLRGMIWQPFTYMFLHADLGHIFWNMFGLWMFGRDIEEAWGPRSFLTYYLFTGTGAGILSFLAGIGSIYPTIGASGAIFGILLAYGMLFPNNIVLVFFMFPMRARTVVILFGAFELWMTLSAGPQAGGVARLAHLGGMGFGYLYLKYGDWMRLRLPRFRISLGSRGGNTEKDWEGFMREEVDPILEKIGREGIHSLTRKERKILKKARGRRKAAK